VKRTVKNHWPKIIIAATLLILFIQNYTPGTYLSGWDNLHPEFNLWANIKRSIFSVWQEYQGLGLLAGMGHAADLPRQLILLILSVFIPKSFLRYFYHFAMIAAGAFGSYFLAKEVLPKEEKAAIRKELPALTGALFYLLHFASVQYFNFPFEPYSTSWGIFPWLILATLRLLKRPSKKNWLLFVIINILAIPVGYVQTVFIFNSVSLGTVLLSDLIRFGWRKRLKIIITILFTIFCINSFWLLPAGYFSLTSVEVTKNSNMNLIITDQFFEQSKRRGRLTDFISLAGPLVDSQEFSSGKEDPNLLFGYWQEHFKNPLTQAIAVVLFSLSILGAFSRNKFKWPFVVVLFMGATALISTTPPFSIINSFLRSIGLINQIFRYPFTKVIAPVILSMAILASLGSYFLLTRISESVSAVIIPLIFFFSLPSFYGNYINPKMRVKIPQEYFQLFEYLKEQDPTKRIADLPQYNFWGWYYYKWHSFGSGFIWYGINQPIMDRTFDVWSDELENYYWQVFFVLNSRNSYLFDQILEKYAIDYLLFDRSVYFPEAANSGKVSLENEKLIKDSGKLFLEKSFGPLDLYRVNKEVSSKNYLALANNLPVLENGGTFINSDCSFLNHGAYLEGNQPEVIYPFCSLFSQRAEQDQSLLTTEVGQSVRLERLLNLDLENYQLTLPNQELKEKEGKEVKVLTAVEKGKEFITVELKTDWQKCFGVNQTINNKIGESVSFVDCGGNLEGAKSYLLKIEVENISGLPFLIKVFSTQDNRLYLDTRIQESGKQKVFYFLPAIYPFDYGIGINFVSRSFLNESENKILNVEIAEIPTPEIESIKLSKKQDLPTASFIPEADFSAKILNQTFYKVSLFFDQAETVALLQSFDPGWKAFYFKGILPRFLTNHVRINGWANAWRLPDPPPRSPSSHLGGDSPTTIYIFFWPQLLEFFGFGLFVLPIILIIRKK